MDETVTDYDAIQKRWHETLTLLRNTLRLDDVPEQEAMYQRHQLADKSIHIITLLHDDGTKSSLRLTPHHDGFSLAVTLGTGKVLHDLTFHREDDASD